MYYVFCDKYLKNQYTAKDIIQKFQLVIITGDDKHVTIPIKVDAIGVARKSTKIPDLMEVLKGCVQRQIHNMGRSVLSEFHLRGTTSLPETFHFKPEPLGHFCSVAYNRSGSCKTFCTYLKIYVLIHKADPQSQPVVITVFVHVVLTSLFKIKRNKTYLYRRPDYGMDHLLLLSYKKLKFTYYLISLAEFRKHVHRLFMLPIERPLFRRMNGYSFATDLAESKDVLRNVHQGLKNVCK